MNALLWWLRECCATFPFRTRKKSPKSDGKFHDLMPAGLYNTFKSVGNSFPTPIGVYEWDDSGKPVRVNDTKK